MLIDNGSNRPDTHSGRTKSGRRLRLGIRCVLLSAFLWPFSMQASAEYRVGAGDQLEILVFGIPELQRRTPVQPDGTISFPLLGTLAVAGRPLPEIRARIKAGLASKVYRQRNPAGSEQALVIGVDEITVAVSEYRPIYVKGGVAKAGEYPFRPSMTVRKAVALSGGYDILPVKISNPYLDTADFRGEYEALWLEYAKQQARVWRLKAELEDRDVGDDTVAQRIPADAPISRVMIARIVDLATDQLMTRRADHERQKAFLKQSIKQMDMRIETMAQREMQEKQGAVTDAQDLKRISALYADRSLVHSRLVEARRNVLLSATRNLETTTELMQLRQQKTDLERQLDRLADARGISLLQELEDATVRLGEVRSKIQSVGEKLHYTALAKAQFTDGAQKKPVITVYRKDGAGGQKQVVDEAFELQPGDVIEIAVGR
ncbi:MAG: polysaccharide biosynthesis/export family protein [Woeseiaceae bacterium]